MTEVSIPADSPWTRERIEELLRSESFNYQAISLPYGLTTGGHDRSSTASAILPEDMSGQSLIDIGCALGFFCFEARRRGAERVVGLDLEVDNIRKGRILAEILGQPIDFQVGDIERTPIGEQFDHVICLNVIHHLADPILGLDRLIAATRRRLILELATFGVHDHRKLGLSWLQQKFLSRSPVLLVARGTAGEGVKQFYITETAIENLLRYRRGCFAKIDLVPSPFKERFLVIAHKRRTGSLMLVGSPHSSASAQIVREIQESKHPEATRFLGLKSATPLLRAEQYCEPQQPEQSELMFDYDFMRPFTSGASTFEHDPALDVIETAEQTRAVTVWMPRDRLVEAAQKDAQAASGRKRKQISRLLKQYRDPRQVARHYRAWFHYLSSKKVDQRVLWVRGDGATLVSVEQWEQDVGQPLLAGAA
jgi:SAM-dependent methyltransferase